MIRIPLDRDGYAIEADGTIHTRYASHVSRDAYRTRTAKGVESVLAGRKGKTCPECYPAPRFTSPRYADTTPRSPQKRRKPAKPKG